MKKIALIATLLLFSASWIYCQEWKTIIAKKDFVSRGAMIRESGDDYYARLMMGKLVMKTARSDGMERRLWLFKNALLDNDYIVEMSIAQTDHSSDYFGLFWGSDNTECGCSFLVSTERCFVAFRDTSAENSDVLAQGDLGDADLSPLGRPDKLRIEKIGDTITFLVNGTKVGQCQATGLFGPYFGVVVDGNQAIEVDDVLVQVR
jgi:hypothetical protein